MPECAFEVIPGSAPESAPSCEDSYGEPSRLRPSVGYFRRDLRSAETLGRAIGVGMVVCQELEQLKAWVEQTFGVTPPKWIVSPDEAKENGYDVEENIFVDW